MQQFIQNIFIFIRDIFAGISNTLYAGTNNEYNILFGLTRVDFINFLNKDIFINSSWIGFNMTYKELFFYFGTIFITILFIVLIVRFIWSLLTIIKDSATKWR